MDLVKNLFPHTSNKGQQFVQDDNALRQEFIEQQAAQARGDIFGIAPAADQNRNMGFQAALDVFGQSMPQQLETFQAGNVGAQQVLQSGMPQFSNAIMGMPVDYNVFRPQTISYNPRFMQQQLPELIDTGSLLSGLNQPQPAPIPDKKGYYG